jgi:hypothetical protein
MGDVELHEISTAVLPYLNVKQPKELQEVCAYQTLFGHMEDSLLISRQHQSCSEHWLLLMWMPRG